MGDEWAGVLLHEDLTEKIIGALFTVHGELGYGFLESVYENAVSHVLRDMRLAAERQVGVDVWFRGRRVGLFRADLVVERAVIVELKAARDLVSFHEAQLLNVLRATNIEVGLLVNFGPKLRFKRLAFSNSRKRGRAHLRTSADDAPRG